MTTQGQSERLLNLMAMLMRAHAPVPTARILQDMRAYAETPSADARVRKFERDKQDLARMGVVLRYARNPGGDPGYTLDPEAFILPRVKLTVEERLILETVAAGHLRADARLRARHPLDRALRSAINKLRVDNAPPGLAQTPEDEEFEDRLEDEEPAPGLFRHRGHGTEREIPVLEALSYALVDRVAVSFFYQRPGQRNDSERTVEPYGLAFVHGAWYLVGHDRGRRELRIFKLLRIRGRPKGVRRQTGADAPYTIPEAFSLEDAVASLLHPAAAGRGTGDVILHADPEVAFAITDELGDAEVRWPDGPDGHARITVRRPLADPLWRLCARYAPFLRVVSPADVREAFRARLVALRNAYDDGAADAGTGTEQGEG